MRNQLNVSGSKPLKDIWREKQAPGKQEASSAELGHVLTHGNGKDRSDKDVDCEGTKGTGIVPDSDESGERILEASVCTIGGANGKCDAGSKLEADLEFRARVGTGRTDLSVLRAEARAILVRLLARLYVDREKAVNKPAA
jgi:hypothetical protein